MGSRTRETARITELERAGALSKGLRGARAERVVPTGLPALDAILPGGGIPCGYLTELVGPPSCGKLGIATCLLGSALLAGGRAALVDAGRSFFPALSADLVRSLAGLLVCRVGSVEDGLVAAELLAESGAFDVVAADLVVRGASPSAPGLARLERAARAGGSAVAVVTEPPRGATTLAGGVAALRLEIASGGGRWAGLVESRVRVGRSRFGATGSDVLVRRFA